MIDDYRLHERQKLRKLCFPFMMKSNERMLIMKWTNRLCCASFTAVWPAVLLVFPNSSTAQPKTSISGWLRVGAEYTWNETYSESFYQAKVQFETEIEDDLETQIDIRGESDTHEMELREAFLTADLGKAIDLEFGHSKKRFGYEFQKSKEKLKTVDRTLLYQYLEPLGLVGRELNLRYHRKARPEVRRIGLSGSIGYNEAHDFSVIGHVTRLNTLGDFALGGSGTIKIDKIQEGTQTVWSSALELVRDTEAHHVELEGLLGIDPLASEVEKKVGDGRNVHFLGGKFLYAHRMKTASRLIRAVEPVLVASFLARDLDEIGRNTISTLAGLNFYIAKNARISMNVDLQLTSTPTDHSERSTAGSNGVVQMELQW